MTTGVYTVHLIGTPLVWVGESGRIEARFKAHRKNWVWPNEAAYTIVREMPNSSRSDRVATEAALSRLLKRRGFWMLSETAYASGKVGGIMRAPHLNSLPPAERKEMARKGGLAAGPKNAQFLQDWRQKNPDLARETYSEQGREQGKKNVKHLNKWARSKEGRKVSGNNLIVWNKSSEGRKSRSESNRKRCKEGKCGHPSHKARRK